ncbi:DUF262 domain-containing protein [Nocardiopsis sp. LDBS0036]|uniref:DUF262 domain-containing protein n=1 Tax=Nocardiopsis sp. LDBS0036 TaxID=3104276 RepID=UPI0035196515
MKAYETTFQKLAGGLKQFQVPLYQRPYSWGRKELEQLWADLTEQMESDEDQGHHRPSAVGHFIGSVVLAPGSSSASGLDRWLVIDGQQRLTTLSVALAAVRDRLLSMADEDAAAKANADRIHEIYLVNRHEVGDDKYRLMPTQLDRHAYRALVNGDPNAGGSDTIGYAYNFFLSNLTSHTVQELVRVEAAIGRRLSLVEIQAETGDNVYRIFESLNNTGKKLSQTDLLRNFVFMLLPQTGQEVYDEVWLPMQDELGPDTLETLAWLDLVLRGDEKAKQSEVYNLQKSRLDKISAKGGEKAIRAELEQLRRLGQLLLKVMDSHGYEDDPELAKCLHRLESWGNAIYRPLALHLMVLRDQGQAATEDVVRALEYVESFLVRRMLAGTATNNLNRIFMSAPKEIEPGSTVADAVHRYLSHPRRLWPGDKAFSEAIATRSFYWSGKPFQKTFVLRRLEESYGAAEPVDFEQAKLTIEHVMPQSPTHEWLEVLRGQTDPGETDIELHERLLHTLGNITLSGQNSKLSNHMFERKQKIFQTSALRMNQEIAEAPSWGRPEIEARAARLIERAIRLWPAPLPSSVEPTREDRISGPILDAVTMVGADNWTTHRELALLAGVGTEVVNEYLAKAQGLPHENSVFLDAETALRSGRSQSEFVPAAVLAGLVGLEVDPNVEREHRFRSLLAKHQPTAVVEAVNRLLEHWLSQGGDLLWGGGTDTSCFLMAWDRDVSPEERWALVLYPMSGRVEVVFQYLATRPPFDRMDLRQELYDRLNSLTGVDLPEGSLKRRPGFPIHALSDNKESLPEILVWFREQCREWLTAQGR